METSSLCLDGCRACPRNCGVDRSVQHGFCGVGEEVLVARASLHPWEENCISGTRGSGTIFFAGCNLRCVYCQNQKISRGRAGKVVSIRELGDIMLSLQSQGAHNINLVTPTHYIVQILEAIHDAKTRGLHIPIVYNCGGYEKTEAIAMLEGVVDIFLTDFKYVSSELSAKYSGVSDYFSVAADALSQMVKQSGTPEFDANGMMEKGVLVRHLMLPGCIKDSKAVLSYLFQTFGHQIYISIMSQFTPMADPVLYPELARPLYPAEYRRLVEYAVELGIEHGFIQEGDVAKESFIPDF